MISLLNAPKIGGGSGRSCARSPGKVIIMFDDNCILIDWLAFTLKEFELEEVFDVLGFQRDDFISRSGHYGYRQALFCSGIWVLYDGQPNMGICVEMSGQGCRYFETISTQGDLVRLLEHFIDNPRCCFTRLDVAYDDIDKQGSGLLNVSLIERYLRKDYYVSSFRSKSASWSGTHSDTAGSEPLAYSCYVGSPSSDLRFRIYDKAMERGGLDYHWTRFEIQLRRDAVYGFVRSPGTVGYKFVSVINKYLRFVKYNKNDSNRRRWESPQWWLDFVAAAGEIQLYSKKDIEYNLSRVEHYVFSMAGNSIYTYLQIVGADYFLKKVAEREAFLSSLQEDLIKKESPSFQQKLDNRESYTRTGVKSDFKLQRGVHL